MIHITLLLLRTLTELQYWTEKLYRITRGPPFEGEILRETKNI